MQIVYIQVTGKQMCMKHLRERIPQKKLLYLHGGTYYGSTTQYVSYER